MLSTTRLNHLIVLAEECHFARAAKRVHLSQPAFSRSIQAMEQQMGLQLFDRQAGKIQLTPAGEFLIERAKRLLFEARGLEHDLKLFKDNQLGQVSFGVGPFPKASLLSDVITAARHEYPQLGLKVEASNWRLLLDLLLREEIEFLVAFTPGIAANPTVTTVPLMTQHARFYVRQDHPLGDAPVSLRQVWAYGVATVMLPPAQKTALAQVLGIPSGEALGLTLECDDVELLHQTALHTDTVVSSTDCSVQSLAYLGALRPLTVTDFPVIPVPMNIVSLRNRSFSPGAKVLISIFQRIAQAQSASVSAAVTATPPP